MINYFKKFFKINTYSCVIVLHMKSGKVFRIPCGSFTWKYDSETGSVSSYNFEGYKANCFRYVNMKEIEFITSESYSIFKRY